MAEQNQSSMVVIETMEQQRQRHAAALEAREQEPLDEAVVKGGVFQAANGEYVNAKGEKLSEDAVKAYEQAHAAREQRFADRLAGKSDKPKSKAEQKAEADAKGEGK